MRLRVPFALVLLSTLGLAACGNDSDEPVASRAPAKPVVAIAPARPVAAAGTPAANDLPSGVYVWQRVWLPANLMALADSRTVFAELRVLAAQDQPGEGWVDAKVDLASLKSDGRTVRPVIRLDGRVQPLDAKAVADRADSLVAKWRAAGVKAGGVEIDFDCPASRLGEYAKLLAAVKAKLPADATLSVTALPSWLGSPGLDAVLAQSDEAVLQVHAVSDPAHGLFDPKQARTWIDAFAKATGKPFRVALPAYGSALVVDAQGNRVGVESEAGLPQPGTRLELFADPVAVAGLVREIKHDAPAHFSGFVWFRLPLPGDRRAWPLATISAVIADRPLKAEWSPDIADNGRGGFDVTVRNSGNLEAPLPASVDVEGVGCADADALPGYRLERSGGKPRFVRESGASLPATQTRPIGWVRCTHLVPADLHVHA